MNNNLNTTKTDRQNKKNRIHQAVTCGHISGGGIFQTISILLHSKFLTAGKSQVPFAARKIYRHPLPPSVRATQQTICYLKERI